MRANNDDVFVGLLFLMTAIAETMCLAMAFFFSAGDRLSAIFWICSAIYLHVSRPLLMRSVARGGDGRPSR
jgi:hypothetical protein